LPDVVIEVAGRDDVRDQMSLTESSNDTGAS
jgi:hypothetical protein